MEQEMNKNRNIGLDLLRILSMLMIIVLHYLGKGNFIDYDENKITFIIANIFESICIVAVNCYVLISGYFLIKSKFSWKKVFWIWGETLFYSIFIYVILIFSGIESFSIKDLIRSFFPIITKEYWFVNTYLLMYILFPFMNRLIENLEKQELRRLIFIFFDSILYNAICFTNRNEF